MIAAVEAAFEQPAGRLGARRDAVNIAIVIDALEQRTLHRDDYTLDEFCNHVPCWHDCLHAVNVSSITRAL
jgi:hypothetical protein